MGPFLDSFSVADDTLGIVGPAAELAKSQLPQHTICRLGPCN